MKKVVFTVLTMLVLLLASCGQAPQGEVQGEIQVEEGAADVQESTIKIGFIGPLTGDLASIGQGNKNGIMMAVDEINAAGGVNGQEIEIIYEDGMCDGKAGSTAINKLVNVDGVSYIAGGLCSGETLAAAPVAEEAEVVMISPCSSSPAVTDAGDYIFRVYPSDSFQGKYAAEYAYNEMGVTKAAIMACLNDWCSGLRDVFTETFEGLGGEIVEVQEFEQGTADLRTQITKVKDAEPELVYFLSYTETTTAALKQVQELGLEAPLLGGDTWSDSTIWESTEGYNEGAMYVVPHVEEPQEFVDAYHAAYGQDAEITLCASQGYDIINLYAQQIEAHGNDPTAVKDGLYGVENYEGASGTISFDENGDLASASYNVMVIQDGSAVVKE